ncbi:MAG: hypothetical protein PHS81_01355 [Candidatus Nanoarchaeia archaeon]|nr:hypothetical protein [Candidatus Nanoarchaeia archaeon]
MNPYQIATLFFKKNSKKAEKMILNAIKTPLTIDEIIESFELELHELGNQKYFCGYARLNAKNKIVYIPQKIIKSNILVYLLHLKTKKKIVYIPEETIMGYLITKDSKGNTIEREAPACVIFDSTKYCKVK